MNHKGFTLIELLVAMGVGTVILFSVVGALYMITRTTPQIRSEIIVLADLERAAHWLTRDVQMGQASNLVDYAPPVTLMTVSWNDFTKAADLEGAISHSVIYTWSSETGELERNFDGLVTIVGTQLTNVGFSITDRSVTITLTSSNSEESKSRTRVYTILMRSEE